jgi:hypothetical protein
MTFEDQLIQIYDRDKIIVQHLEQYCRTPILATVNKLKTCEYWPVTYSWTLVSRILIYRVYHGYVEVIWKPKPLKYSYFLLISILPSMSRILSHLKFFFRRQSHGVRDNNVWLPNYKKKKKIIGRLKYTVNQLLFAAAIFCDFSVIKWFAVSNFRD